MSKSGKIIPHGVKPEPHELETILYFTNLGKTIELIPESHTPGVKSPDFWMDWFGKLKALSKVIAVPLSVFFIQQANKLAISLSTCVV